jgi:hypothetical protein
MPKSSVPSSSGGVAYLLLVAYDTDTSRRMSKRQNRSADRRARAWRARCYAWPAGRQEQDSAQRWFPGVRTHRRPSMPACSDRAAELASDGRPARDGMTQPDRSANGHSCRGVECRLLYRLSLRGGRQSLPGQEDTLVACHQEVRHQGAGGHALVRSVRNGDQRRVALYWSRPRSSRGRSPGHPVGGHRSWR